MIGEFFNGLPNGRGIYRNRILTFLGIFSDKPNYGFKGIFRYGSVYLKDVIDLNDEESYKYFPLGEGVIKYPSGEIYEGPIRKAKPHGKGTLKFSNGNILKTEFIAGFPEPG